MTGASILGNAILESLCPLRLLAKKSKRVGTGGLGNSLGVILPKPL